MLGELSLCLKDLGTDETVEAGGNGALDMGQNVARDRLLLLVVEDVLAQGTLENRAVQHCRFRVFLL